MPHARTLASVAASIALALSAGCAATGPIDDASTRPGDTPHPAAPWIAAIRPTAEAVGAGDLWGHNAPERPFQYTLNDASRPVIHRFETDDKGAETVSWIDAESGTLLSSQRITRTADGGVASAASVVADRGVESRFRPALLILDRAMAPGVPAVQTVEVLVADADKPARIKHRGKATNTVELVGEGTIDAAGRSIRCIVIRSTFDATFGPAVVHRVAHRWYEPGAGLIAEHAHERVRTFGIETENRHETWIATQ
jgi:hypothetical protein